MSLATFKDLCIDATDVEAMAAFWAPALGLRQEVNPGRSARLVGPTPAHTIWIIPVPEAKSVQHRMHIDVHASSVDDLVALGASVIDDESFRWTVMADPEGGEFCAFVREEAHDYRLYEIVVQSSDHAALSAWWHNVIGGTRVVHDSGYSWLEDVPNMPFEALSVVPVDEAKQVKNRVHIDLTATAAVAETVAKLVASGATLLREPGGDIEWHVMADPQGNEFCLFGRQ